MARIANLTVNTDRSVTLTTDTGDILTMSSALAGVFREQYVKRDVRDAIRYACADMDGDDISLGSFDGSEDDFVEEVFSSFEEEIEYGNYPNEDDIKNAIIDTADAYGICIDD